MFRNIALASALALGGLITTQTASADHFHFRPQVAPWQCQTFDCRHDAYDFQCRQRRCGYETRLVCRSRCYHVYFRRPCEPVFTGRPVYDRPFQGGPFQGGPGFNGPGFGGPGFDQHGHRH